MESAESSGGVQTWIDRLLWLPDYHGPELNRRARLLRTMVLAMLPLVTLALLVGLLFNIHSPALEDELAILSTVSLAVLVAMLALLRSGQFRAALLAATLLLIGLPSAFVLFGDGLVDLGMLLFPLAIVFGSQLHGNRSYVAMVTIILLVYLAAAIGHLTGGVSVRLSVVSAVWEGVFVSLSTVALAWGMRLQVSELLSNLARARSTEQLLLAQNEALQAEARQRADLEAELARYNAGLAAMVDERTAALREAVDTLATQERLVVMGQLAGKVAHELRNPLGVITNAVFFLNMRGGADPALAAQYGQIAEQAHAVDTVISQLLRFARPANPQPVALAPADALADAVAQVQARRTTAHVSVDSSGLAGAGAVFCDRGHLATILEALLDNALDAMPDGGQAMVTASRTGNSVAIALHDSGHGIPAHLLKHVTEPLVTTRPGRLGVGLPIVVALLHSNDGSLTIASSDDAGTTVTLSLPTPPEAAP